MIHGHIKPQRACFTNPLGRTIDTLCTPHVNVEEPVQSLLLTATRGSELLLFERVRLREVRRTELLIEPDKTPSYCHSLLEPCDRVSEELRGEVCLE